MNMTIDKMVERIQSLLGDLDFSWDDRALDSPEKALEVGERYNRELERLTSMGKEQEERIFNLMFSILAMMLQMLAIREYGNDGEEAIRNVVEDIYNKPNVKADIKKLSKTIEKALMDSTLTKEQVDLVMTRVINEIPHLLMDGLTEHYTPYRLLPLMESRSIASTLSDMMKEADDGDDTAAN